MVARPAGMITDVPGIRVGHATDARGITGCTVVLAERPAVGGVELRGWANAIHGLDFLDPRHLVPTLDGVILCGGSAFGLEAVYGVMQCLEERGVGFRAGPTVVPHVAGAALFDLGVGDPKARPGRAMGYQASQAAKGGAVEEGNVGAGMGATVGKLFGRARAMKGGTGTAGARVGDAIVGVLVAVNALGDVRDPETGALLAGTRDTPDGHRLVDTAQALASGVPLPSFAPKHTTLGVLATDARLTKPEATRVAQIGMLGFARALSPPHTGVDGDTLFCLSVGDLTADPTAVGLAAAEAVAQAICRAIRAAESLPGLPASKDL